MNEITTTQLAAEPVFAYETLAPEVAEMARAAAAEIKASLSRHVEEAVMRASASQRSRRPFCEFGKWLAA